TPRSTAVFRPCPRIVDREAPASPRRQTPPTDRCERRTPAPPSGSSARTPPAPLHWPARTRRRGTRRRPGGPEAWPCGLRRPPVSLRGGGQTSRDPSAPPATPSCRETGCVAVPAREARPSEVKIILAPERRRNLFFAPSRTVWYSHSRD